MVENKNESFEPYKKPEGIDETYEMLEQAEAIQDFKNPKTYKEKADLIQMDLKKKQALASLLLEDKKEKPKEVHSNQFKVASLQFEHLLKSMDRSHASFMHTMGNDPSIDQERLKQLYKDNYTQSLEKLRLDIDMHHDPDLNELSAVERMLQIGMKEELDRIDQQRVKDKKFDYIGVKARVNSNVPLTKEQKLIKEKQAILEARLKRTLRKQLEQKLKRARIFRKKLQEERGDLLEKTIDEYEELGQDINRSADQQSQAEAGHRASTAGSREKVTQLQEDLKLVLSESTTQNLRDKRRTLTTKDLKKEHQRQFSHDLNKAAKQQAVVEGNKRASECNTMMYQVNILNDLGKEFIARKISQQHLMLDAVQEQVNRTAALDVKMRDSCTDFNKQKQLSKEVAQEKLLINKQRAGEFLRTSRTQFHLDYNLDKDKIVKKATTIIGRAKQQQVTAYDLKNQQQSSTLDSLDQIKQAAAQARVSQALPGSPDYLVNNKTATKHGVLEAFRARQLGGGRSQEHPAVNPVFSNVRLSTIEFEGASDVDGEDDQSLYSVEQNITSKGKVNEHHKLSKPIKTEVSENQTPRSAKQKSNKRIDNQHHYHMETEIVPQDSNSMIFTEENNSQAFGLLTEQQSVLNLLSSRLRNAGKSTEGKSSKKNHFHSNSVKRQRYLRDLFIEVELKKFLKQKADEQEEYLKTPARTLFEQLEQEMIYQDKRMNSLEAVEHARELAKAIRKKEETQGQGSIIEELLPAIAEKGNKQVQKVAHDDSQVNQTVAEFDFNRSMLNLSDAMKQAKNKESRAKKQEDDSFTYEGTGLRRQTRLRLNTLQEEAVPSMVKSTSQPIIGQKRPTPTDGLKVSAGRKSVGALPAIGVKAKVPKSKQTLDMVNKFVSTVNLASDTLTARTSIHGGGGQLKAKNVLKTNLKPKYSLQRRIPVKKPIQNPKTSSTKTKLQAVQQKIQKERDTVLRLLQDEKRLDALQQEAQQEFPMRAASKVEQAASVTGTLYSLRDAISTRQTSRTGGAESSIAEQMLNLTRNESWNYQIKDHHEEVKDQLLNEAQTKLFALQTQLVKIEGKRVKRVPDQLQMTELTQKIDKANSLIARLTFGTPKANNIVQRQFTRVDYDDYVAKKSERNLRTSKGNIDVLRQVVTRSLTKDSVSQQSLAELQAMVGGFKSPAKTDRLRIIM